ncbi:hypothetical protein PF005_g21104 [Phytophthora fragariae]|uniref:Uncharacterized protein n=1 Tax=Phytophthora fragariae TaxID=53985 RepID=A0A6A3SUN3_9STRA|nr:hypothetical protein PF009_g19342 [Phytophthora fragariae]KAE9085096.1 hypothetical protein PF007_g21272 [Phytophthora fragariae]KAE9123680.1 hypothetical protein PF006_g17372 [Phytophthora fragariae]KAE9185809.1 hypothetical protein PF005_g21104 [Phytophthora fragariae]KAE9207642.1 hypothetical protein PF002_g19647 [Phytophthora fragariae]
MLRGRLALGRPVSCRRWRLSKGRTVVAAGRATCGPGFAAGSGADVRAELPLVLRRGG